VLLCGNSKHSVWRMFANVFKQKLKDILSMKKCHRALLQQLLVILVLPTNVQTYTYLLILFTCNIPLHYCFQSNCENKWKKQTSFSLTSSNVDRTVGRTAVQNLSMRTTASSMLLVHVNIPVHQLNTCQGLARAWCYIIIKITQTLSEIHKNTY